MITVISVSELCALRIVGTCASAGNSCDQLARLTIVFAFASDHDAETFLPIVAGTCCVSIYNSLFKNT